MLKEFPVLGEGSVEAARVAVAARMQDTTGKKYIEFHQKLLGGRGAADKARALAVAKEVGFDMARIEKDMNSDEVKKTIDENLKLADALGVNGTPSYVVGEELRGRGGRHRHTAREDRCRTEVARGQARVMNGAASESTFSSSFSAAGYSSARSPPPFGRPPPFPGEDFLLVRPVYFAR